MVAKIERRQTFEHDGDSLVVTVMDDGGMVFIADEDEGGQVHVYLSPEKAEELRRFMTVRL